MKHDGYIHRYIHTRTLRTREIARSFNRSPLTKALTGSDMSVKGNNRAERGLKEVKKEDNKQEVEEGKGEGKPLV